MTDIAFKPQTKGNNSVLGYFTGGDRRRERNDYNVATHFIFGKHPTTHMSETHIKTQLRTGLQSGKQSQGLSSA